MAEPKMIGPKTMGWCPGALRPMMSGDGLVVRIRARSGRLIASQLAEIARLSVAHGNGILELSARANLQLRGVSPDSHPALIDGLRALDLIDADIAAESRRNVTMTPFWQPGDRVAALNASLCDALAGSTLSLPSKFGFSVDDGAVLRGSSADIRLEVVASGVLVFADGSEKAGRFDEGQAARAALALADWFLNSGGARDGRGRMAAHLARGAVVPTAYQTHTLPMAQTAPTGPGDFPGIGRLIALEFGQISAETLAALAQATPALRLTPWRMVLSETGGAPDLPGLIHDPASPLLQVTACTGKPGCLQALGETRALARALAPLTPAALHVSGCAKGCAFPRQSPLTLTATAHGFDLGLNAKAGESPVETGLPPDPFSLSESLTRHAASL